MVMLAGCTTSPAPKPDWVPLPPQIKVKRYAQVESPKAATTPPRRLLRAGSPARVPSWMFPALNSASTNGTYRIDASTNLTLWWTMAVVYNTTNITITSDTVAKRPSLFYRVVPIN